MRRGALRGLALATVVSSIGCRSLVTVLSSVDAGPSQEGGVQGSDAGFPDGPGGGQGSADGAEVSDVAGEADSASPDDGAGVLQGDAPPPTGDASEAGDAPSCGICTGGMTCVGGSCVCPPGFSSCAGACVDEEHDTANCGACGQVCSAIAPLPAACTGGRCLVELYSGAIASDGIATDGTNVYWTSVPGGGPMRVSSGGGTSMQLVPISIGSVGRNAVCIALDATAVYFTDYDDPTGEVMMLPLGGGTATTLASNQDLPSAIAVDAANVYWVNQGSVANNASLMKVPKSGGAPIALASAFVLPNVPNAGSGSIPSCVAVDATRVYWTTSEAIMMVSTGGGTATTLAAATNVARIALDETSVYWTSPDEGTVESVSKNGGTAVPLASGQVRAYGIAVDATNVYWTTADGVLRVPKAGGTPTVLVSGEETEGLLAVDATSIYWTVVDPPWGHGSTSPGGFTVMKLTPK